MTPIEYTMGSNTFGTRVSNALKREGIFTIEALRELRETLGETGFANRMEYIRGIGKDAMERINQALSLHSSSFADMPKVALPDALPTGFRERLADTLQHLIDQNMTSDQKLMPGVAKGDHRGPLAESVGGSLTAGDLEELGNLFLGYRWHLNRRTESEG